jgi:hypothetical protein
MNTAVCTYIRKSPARQAMGYLTDRGIGRLRMAGKEEEKRKPPVRVV